MNSRAIHKLSRLRAWHILTLSLFLSVIIDAAMGAFRRGGLPFELPGAGTVEAVAVGFVVASFVIRLARSSARLVLKKEALRQSEERFRLTLENAPIGMEIVNLDGNIMSVNKAFCEMTGYTADELLSMHSRDITHPDDVEPGLVLVGELMRGEINNFRQDKRYVRKDGSIMDAVLRVALVRDSRGTPIHFVSQVKDVTTVRRAEDALREEKEFTDNALNALPDLFLVIDTGERMLRWNKAVNDVTGYSDEEIALMRPADFVPEDERKLLADAIETVLREGYHSEEMTVVTRDGRKIPYEFIGSLLRDSEGHAVGICGTGRDITERKLAEEALELTNRQLKDIFDNLDEVFFSVDMADSGKLRISQACQKVYGLPERAFSENPMLWKEVILPEDIPVVDETEPELLNGKPVKQTYRIIRPDGQIRWVEARIKPTMGPSGEVVRIDGIVSDITERRRAEEEKARLEQHLFQSRKLEAIGHLAGGIAHDFQNIMAIIQGNMELALAKSPVYLRGYIQKTMRAAERGTALVTNLLHFSEKSPVSFGAVDIAAMVQETVRLMADSGERMMESRINVEPGLWKVKGDQAQVHQVVMNLYLNARDAVMECMEGNGRPFAIDIALGNVHVAGDDIRENPRARKGDFVRLSFRDNGGGMDSETLAHVFEPFFTTKAGKGTGLGLSTVYGIVNRHGGWIDVRSEAGEWTVFDVYLPRFTGPFREEPQEKRAKRNLGGNETILLVDDEEDILSAVREKLGDLGYRVLVAQSGEEALGILKKRRGKIDLVVLDQVMPGIQGTEVLKEVRRLNPRTQVLMYSGKDLSSNAGLPEGVSAIIKPYGLEALAGKVGDILGAEWRYPVRSHINRVKLYYVEEPTVPHTEELTDAETVYRLFRHVAHEPRETFIAVYLDSQNRAIAYDKLSTGTTNKTVVYPKEVVRAALMSNACSVILLHNHPAGGLRPSHLDVLLTASVQQACEGFEIRLKDHLILSEKGYFSFRKEKIL
jgi:two-component system cell cycle sensor histidine kinase/response regulator CckA